MVTQTSNIFIFGDSFAAPWPNCYTWHDMLYDKVNENQKNFALSGIGSMTIMEKFFDKLDNDEIQENDKIIIFLSESTRIKFPFLKAYNDEAKVSYYYKKRKIIDNNDKYIKENIVLMNTLFDVMKNEIEKYNFKTILTLYGLSRILKNKIIIFNGFRDFVNSIRNKITLENLNDECFKYYNQPLINLENNDQENYNHMSSKNHEILTNIICNFFYDMKLNEEFVRNNHVIKKENNYIYS